MILVAKIYFNTKEFLKLLVSLEEQVIVSGHCVHLWEPLFDAKECQVDILDRHMKNLFDERGTAFAIDHSEENSVPTLTREYEVCLDISNSASRIDICGPFVDEGSLGERLLASSFL